MTDEIEWVKYYASLHDGFVREWPSGLRRCTKVFGHDYTSDAAWTRNRRWEPTQDFFAHEFGKDDGEYLVVEVPEAEAELIRSMIGVRPKGGPFTEEGQAWLAEHPERPEAKYLRVTPEYDFARRMVSPRDPDTIMACDVSPAKNLRDS